MGTYKQHYFFLFLNRTTGPRTIYICNLKGNVNILKIPLPYAAHLLLHRNQWVEANRNKDYVRNIALDQLQAWRFRQILTTKCRCLKKEHDDTTKYIGRPSLKYTVEKHFTR